MSRKKWPPLDPGTKVKTIRSLPKENTEEWTKEWETERKWGVQGVVVTHHDSHGLCYEVRHLDGSIGCYDPSELEVIHA